MEQALELGKTVEVERKVHVEDFVFHDDMICNIVTVVHVPLREQRNGR